MKHLLLLLCLVVTGGVAPAQSQGPGDATQPGKTVYEANCAQCHRTNGAGLPATFPALNNNPFVVGDPNPVIATVLNGLKGNLGQMPAWQDKLDNEQIAAVVTYIRQAWSNRAAPVTPAMVAARRRK